MHFVTKVTSTIIQAKLPHRFKPEPIQFSATLPFVEVNKPTSTSLVLIILPHRLNTLLKRNTRDGACITALATNGLKTKLDNAKNQIYFDTAIVLKTRFLPSKNCLFPNTTVLQAEVCIYFLQPNELQVNYPRIQTTTVL
jgi:hypothetical protein